jgi:pilus assembly protein Flp/PilA
MIPFITALVVLCSPTEHKANSWTGQGLVEYSLIIVLIAVAVIAAMSAVGGQIQSIFSKIASSLAVP